MLRGPKAARGQIAESILTAAREEFAAHGYAATTLQGVARIAGVDTKLVRYYFTDKPSLFDACITVPDRFLDHIRASVDVPVSRRGEAAVRAMLALWSDPDLARVLRTVLLIAAHDHTAMARVRMIFTEGLVPAITRGLPPQETSIRGGLITGQMVGLAFTRFVFALEDAAAVPEPVLIALVGETIQQYLTHPLPVPSAHEDTGDPAPDS
ncbi:TetR family transcriptional regulator [Nakamurella flavida]|uniref:TetR family transcriptional regulator n=1 Tax=Nakamurella flavida TaxID=363630 RepID=A0A938YC82_9ACTN|nr:TetR/AcrR family transcriptional regulator [Nakamurella flavida]MBM9474995.1 TetR family transcriptional regulator [Nakamurella flavida]MDP9776564.1 AcrR family transcriptional regulator [Nakamurella flavida]